MSENHDFDNNEQKSTSTVAQSSSLRERKRASDRISQQAARARTKAYIAHLEQTNARLSRSRNGDNSAISSLLDEKYAELERLRNVITTVKRTIEQVSDIYENASRVDSKHVPESVPVVEVGTCRAASPICKTTKETSDVAPLSDQDSTVPYPDPFENSLFSMPPPLNFTHHNVGQDYFDIMNRALLSIESVGAAHMVADSELDDDINITAVLSGWESAQARNHLDIGWKFLQALDQGLFRKTDPVTRIAILYTMRTLIMVRLNPSFYYHRVASYMKPTTMQAHIDHPRLVDFFVWPQVREYLIVHGINFAPHTLAARFAADVEFRWPFDLRDICHHIRKTDRHVFSGAFKDAHGKLDSWQFTSPMMMQYLGPRDTPSPDEMNSDVWAVNFQSPEQVTFPYGPVWGQHCAGWQDPSLHC